MATYKVIQDIEAEDKLLGPLTLKQFIYAIIVVVCGFIAFRLATVAWYLALPFLPPMIVFGILAAPLGRDQSTEVWLLAKLRYFIKPRQRIWDQSGIVNLVTVTVPKRIDSSAYTNNLSETEVRSRLKALSDTIDSRGWAVRNINVNLFAQPNASPQVATPSTDRLIELPDTSAIPKDDIRVEEDMLDEENNPAAQQLDQMIKASGQAHRQQTLQKMASIRKHQAEIKQVRPDVEHPGAGSANWFMDQSAAASDQARGDVFTSQSFSASTAAGSPAAPVTAAPDPAILKLADNDDLNVATIARQANRQDKPEGEVTISLR